MVTDTIDLGFWAAFQPIYNLTYQTKMRLSVWESLLTQGWRHNACEFFRMSHDRDEDGKLLHVMPVRNRLKGLTFTRSQQRILRRNSDLHHTFLPIKNISDDRHEMFFAHINRFREERRPCGLSDYVLPGSNPFKVWELAIYKDDKLIGASYVDVTRRTLSSTYAMYDLNESARSLGFYSMMLEMEIARARKIPHYYSGYTYLEPTSFDYKKRFGNMEYFNWYFQKWYPIHPNEDWIL